MKRLTANQIIDETVEYYSNNPRSIHSKSGCVYLNEENGAMCAVGRCLTKTSLKIVHKRFEGKSAYVFTEFKKIKFKARYRGYLTALWVDLQLLHDNSKYWENNKLSELGLAYVEALKRNQYE
jgi:hypothetical protein